MLTLLLKLDVGEKGVKLSTLLCLVVLLIDFLIELLVAPDSSSLVSLSNNFDTAIVVSCFVISDDDPNFSKS